MQKQLDTAIEKFKDSQTSLDSYQAISDFVKIILSVPAFIEQVEKEGEIIHNAQIELSADKGDFSREHNKLRDKKGEALFQLDPLFPLRNLQNVHQGIQTKNIADSSAWLFRRFSPIDPLPESDRKEYQGFIDKLYKKILPFLEPIEKIEFGFNEDESILYFQEKKTPISLKNDKSNAHYILKHIFSSDDFNQKFSFTEIAEDTFEETNNNWRKYYRACEDINKKVYKSTKIDDFLEFTTGKSGWVRIDKKYLK